MSVSIAELLLLQHQHKQLVAMHPSQFRPSASARAQPLPAEPPAAATKPDCLLPVLFFYCAAATLKRSDTREAAGADKRTWHRARQGTARRGDGQQQRGGRE